MKRFTRTITIAMLCAIFAFSAAAQGQIASGEYGSLVLGVDLKGRLTGYFFEATGVEDNGRPRFTCSFLLQGNRGGGDAYDVITWHPNSPAEVISGRLMPVGDGIELKLDEPHGGCGNVAPDLSSDEGQSFELTKAGTWTAVAMVRSPKAYFHTEADTRSRGKAFVVRGDMVVILRKAGGWADIAFTNSAGRETRGWIKLDDLYPDEPF